MAHKLTAFEFIAAGAGPQVVRLRRGDEVLFQAAFVDWLGVDLASLDLWFEEARDLVIEGVGPAHPYWDGEVPSWLASFNPDAELARIQAVKRAVAGEIRRSQLVVAH